eukprot:15432146-Alexandrium_andersonii.AAC.1
MQHVLGGVGDVVPPQMQSQPSGGATGYPQYPAPSQQPGAAQGYAHQPATQQQRTPRGQQQAHGQQGAGGA